MLKPIIQKRQPLLAGLFSLLLISACVVQADDDGWRIKKRDFKKQVDVIAMTPVAAAEGLVLRPEIAALLEAEISKKVSKKRFDVIAADKYQDFQTAFTADKANSVLSAQIVYVGATFKKDEAEWDGAEQEVEKTENSLYDLMEGDFEGKIGATSLLLEFIDAGGNVMFSGSGGIELVMKRNGKSFISLPADGLLKDEKRLKKAVERALKEF